MLTERIIASAGIVWALTALIAQFVSAWGHGHKDYSIKAGSPIRGVIFNFTWALMPKHKESIRLHPLKFTIGVLMHIGIFVAIAKVLLLLINPQMTPFSPIAFGVILTVATLCGLFLFFRRMLSTVLRPMSSPDDYLSILLTLGLLITAIAHESGNIHSGLFLIYAAILFFYMPFGKLRHALFFFIVRADYGRRLGYRGTYPVKDGAGK